jgi:spore maturation protein CgeB
VKIALFYHSLVSDWNHGNAHFLRGIATELISRRHEVIVYESRDAWSFTNLLAEQGEAPIAEFHKVYPLLRYEQFGELDIDRALDGVELAIVHEWNARSLIGQLGEYRSRHHHLRLFFHDTHHRAVTAPEEIAEFDLCHYDGVLAYGRILRDLYIRNGWARCAWIWHEAADPRVFHPIPGIARTRDLVWIGNWGDEERASELREFLVEPCRALGLEALVHGVRYPEEARAALDSAGIEFGGWLPNFRAPETFAHFRLTVHVPRGPYVRQLPGIPTIRPFEALACGLPLISAPWEDAEGLFTPGKDFLVANSGKEMQELIRAVLENANLANLLAEHGLKTILQRHTCAHRVDELLKIYRSTLGGSAEGLGLQSCVEAAELAGQSRESSGSKWSGSN